VTGPYLISVEIGGKTPAESAILVEVDSPFLQIVSQDGKTVVVAYPTLARGDLECCPTGPASTRRFGWDGSRVVEAEPNPGPVPTSISR
jgi:hypothetical protein